MKDLTRIALLGSDRTEIPEPIKAQMKAMGVVDSDTARAILKAMTKWQMQQKAGYLPSQYVGEWPTGPDLKKERFCSPTATRYLQQMMEGKYERALPEFFQIAQKEGRFLPPEQVPRFLQEASEHPGKAENLKPLMGAQARWLAKQQPEWAALFATAAIDDWENSSFQQRVHLFRKGRETNIPKTVELLHNSWSEFDFRQKKAFLNVMKHSVCLQDEALLEVALEDRRKEVRKAAVELLQAIDGSQLLDRIWQKLDGLIAIAKEKDGTEKPLIELPDEITSDMLRDGIDPSQQWIRGGLRASRLGQMIAVIPPVRWTKKFNKTPEELLNIFMQSDYQVILLQALSHATALHPDDEWAIAILEFWLYHHHLEQWSDFVPKQLCENLSATAFNRIAIPALDYCDQLPSEEDPVTLLIKKNNHPWDETLTRTFITKCKEWISEYSSSYWTAFHLKSIIQSAAYNIDPNLANSLTKSWPTTSASWGSWESDIEGFFKVLRFRKGMREALTEK